MQYLFKLLTISFLWMSFTSCQYKKHSEQSESAEGESRKLSAIKETALPDVINLDKLKQTSFVPALENPVDNKKNTIYAPTLLFAWNKIEDVWESEAEANNTNSTDFKLLIKSTSHQKSMNQDEYKIEAETEEEAVTARAFFHKSLPFKIAFQALSEPIVFDKIKVTAFGMNWHDFDIIEATQILYYRDDEHFILKLMPKDRQHEIIMALGLDKYQSLSDALKLLNKTIDSGKQERKDTKQAWKYVLNEEDKFAIPIVKFHIETNYSNLEGQQFINKDGKHHVLETAYQRTGFVLDQNGATIESESITTVDSIGAEKPHPKMMVYNKPFLIVVKRIDKINPYFVMHVSNAELMVKK